MILSAVNRRAESAPMSLHFHSMRTFADRLKAALAARAVSQNRLEREAGLSKGHVNRLIHGKGARTAPETLVSIAQVLQIDHDWLATGKGTMTADGSVEPLPSPEPPSTVLERDPVEPGLWRRLKDIIGWDEAVAEAKRLFGDQLPDEAFFLAGEIRAKDWPLRADPAMAAQWAKTAMWQKDRDERMRKEMASVAADLAAYRKAQGEQ